jgi:hypothetical protein
MDGVRIPAHPQCSRKNRISDHRSLATARLRQADALGRGLRLPSFCA